MVDLLQLLVAGLATGGIYALAALGFTLLWQTAATINFAQGEFVMLPAFGMLALSSLGLPLVAAFAASCVVAVLVLGWGFQRGFADPLRRFGAMPVVVATIGLSIALRNAVRVGYTAEAQPFPGLFGERTLHLGAVAITAADLGTLAAALVLVVGTQALLARSVTGRAMQAVAQNAETAAVLGIDVPRMRFYAFAINAVLACAAALLVTPSYLAKFDMGESLSSKAFFAAVIGGFNNSRAALIGGIVVGVCENVAAAYVSAAYRDAVALAIFLAVILVRPQGLFGKPIGREV